jgi:hypothetical protein
MRSVGNCPIGRSPIKSHNSKELGLIAIKAIATPGHTDSHMAYQIANKQCGHKLAIVEKQTWIPRAKLSTGKQLGMDHIFLTVVIQTIK